VVESEWVWKQGPNYAISDNGSKVTKSQGVNSWDVTALCERTVDTSQGGKYSWKVRIDHGNLIMIGVADASIDQTKIANHIFDTGLYYYAGNHTVYPLQHNKLPGGAGLSVGDAVGVTLDLDKNEVTFSVNGVDRDTIPNPLKYPRVTLCVTFYGRDDSVTIV